MDAFERLSPALRYQVVHGLGWSGLRPVQEECIPPVLAGHNCLVLAPTAGGKTEAAFLPILSQMDTQGWSPCSTLYLAPLRALLNNQEPRLARLTGLIGRRAFVWHGDVGDAARGRFVREPADVLATTPESLEALLLSVRRPAALLLRHLRAVIIDELHAFAGDDRGAHLVALLERVTRLCGRDLQRIGLSATIGNPDQLCDWLSGSSTRPREVVRVTTSRAPPQLTLDYVGDLGNAAHVIAKLHPGTRRLVFADSRRRVEQLGEELRGRGVETHVTHASLSAGDRAATERAFAEGQSCVIVSTSALELGLDVGDLDHVYQIDCPATVSSLLQRLGRTGRREGARANCTVLATTEEATLQAAALLRLLQAGYVEPVHPSARAVHVLAHQLIALGLQEQGVPWDRWWDQVEGAAAFREIGATDRAALLHHMIVEQIVHHADGRLSLGEQGERLYGKRNFLDLYAVFSTPPMLRVLHGRHEVGQIDASFLQQDHRQPLAFVLGGRAWQVVMVGWTRGVVQVEPASAGVYPRWMGRPVLVSRALCQAMRAVLTDPQEDLTWSRRARAAIAGLRQSYAFLADATFPLVSEPNKVRWWTFGGGRANTLLAAALTELLGEKVTANNLAITFSGEAARSDAGIRGALHELRASGRITPDQARRLASEIARARISKFQPCLPEALERELIASTLLDVDGARATLEEAGPLVHLTVDPGELRRALRQDEVEMVPRRVEPVPPERARVRSTAARPRRPFELVDTASGWERVCALLLQEPVIGLDVETTLTDHRLCLVQIGTAERTYLLDPLAVPRLDPLRPVLASPQVTKVIHNASFERRVLGAVGLVIETVFDTLAVSRALRGRGVLGGHSLESVAARELELVLDKGEQTSDWRRRPLTPSQLDYAALDAEVMLDLYAVFSAEIGDADIASRSRV